MFFLKILSCHLYWIEVGGYFWIGPSFSHPSPHSATAQELITLRLVRFDNLLGRVPHKQSLGFGGRAGGLTDHDYDRGLVQKLILVLLKCVALTTREARYAVPSSIVYQRILMDIFSRKFYGTFVCRSCREKLPLGAFKYFLCMLVNVWTFSNGKFLNISIWLSLALHFIWDFYHTLLTTFSDLDHLS